MTPVFHKHICFLLPFTVKLPATVATFLIKEEVTFELYARILSSTCKETCWMQPSPTKRKTGQNIGELPPNGCQHLRAFFKHVDSRNLKTYIQSVSEQFQ